MGMGVFRPKKVMVTNNKGGVGKTTIVFHLGVELARQGLNVCLVDGDPQSNLTAQCVGDQNMDGLTLRDVLWPQIDGTGDIDRVPGASPVLQGGVSPCVRG